MSRSLLKELVSTNESTDVPTETMMNVIRTHDGIAMGTQEIANQIGMSRQGAKNRLDTLESEDRVLSEEIGGVLVWDLHPGERIRPIPPEIDRLVHAIDSMNEAFEPTRRFGTYVILVGFGLIFSGLTAVIARTTIGLPSNLLLAWGYAFVAGGGVAWILGGGTQFAAVTIKYVAYWRLTGESLNSWTFQRASPESERGQITPRIIVGLLVLFLVGGALVEAAVKFQGTLASVPNFSGFLAAIVAILFFGAIALRILGI